MVPTRQQSGFSLVELSIVLVILGLLVGGVLSGQALIRAAELRAVPSEYARWVAATHAFKDKYMALPGDMTNATAFWGALDGGDGIGSDCRQNATGLQTCNGDGDGTLEWHAASATSTYELFLFWQHLANAGLIEGRYTGSSGGHPGNTICTTGQHWTPGCNAPASKFNSRAFWSAETLSTISLNSFLVDGNYGNTLILARPWGVSASYVGYAMNAEDQWGIDTKLDDGLPLTGKLVASDKDDCPVPWWLPSSDNFYDVQDGNIHCTPVFMNAF